MANWILNSKNIACYLFAALIIFSVGICYADSTALKNSPSPYVSMHANDKVQWQLWNEAVLEKSKKENKLIFLSLGYFSCYWCHVLQRESFNNIEVANLINTHFIPVVVDRELHSSLDAYLIRFAEETLGRGGWPLNVIITPDGYPIIATIYLPKKKFTNWLKQASDLWARDSINISVIAKEAADEMKMTTTQMSLQITTKFKREIDRVFLTEVLSVADEFKGGFGDQSKFPLPVILQSLFNVYSKNENKQLGEFLNLTLNSLRNKGLYDTLDGGYFRYTTDPNWQIPHFEKMLYDNAQIASLYFRAGEVFKNKAYTKIGVHQLDYLISSFASVEGGYYGSYSAIDDAGIEGGYYLWDKKEIAEILSSKEEQVANVIWGWDQPPLLEDKYFPVIVTGNLEAEKKLKLSSTEIAEILQRIIVKLKVERDKRVLPRDDKLLASWNALMLIALVDGFEITGNTRFKNAASSLASFISTKLMVNGELHRSLNKGQLSGNADLEDYAYTANALYQWSKVSEPKLRQQYRALSIKLARTAWKRFWNNGGWKMSDTMIIPNLSQEAMIADGPLPSASAMLIALGFESGDEKLLMLSKNALGFGHNSLKTTPFWYSSYVGLMSAFSD